MTLKLCFHPLSSFCWKALIALYANLNDAARWDEVAALYTEDGSMTRPTAPDAPPPRVNPEPRPDPPQLILER